MKVLTLIVLLAASSFATFAQDQSTDVQTACGPKSASFTVKQDDSAHTPARPEPGKALIYFIQEGGASNGIESLVTRIALDGAWVGAFKHNSYFSVSVNPGEYHACANLQSVTALGKVVAFAQVTAEAAKVYYLGTRARIIGGTTRLEIEPIDVDQAKYLITSSPLSVSQPKE
jgi:hypothetical protein